MTIAEQALTLLKAYQKDINILLRDYFKRELQRGKSIDPLAVDAVKSIEKFVLAGGKRLRPAVLYYAYLAVGGKKRKAIKKASLSIELTHSFLLMHDDIMDQDDKRHGVDTIHKKYEKIARRYFRGKNSKHFGEGMGIVVADLCSTMANKILFSANFTPKTILRALNKLQDIVYEVIPGQMLDFKLGFKGRASEQEILRVQRAKTAYYTFNGPIHLGCILAERTDKKTLKQFTKYAMALGTAFQIRDDILGIFGDEKKLGKPVGSDIIEGKRTLLTNYIVKHGNRQEKKIIRGLLGKESLTQGELQTFREVIKNSGSLLYSQNKGEEMAKEAVTALNDIVFKDKQSEIFFRGIAEYIMNREK